ncbi:hypothetical protein H5410_032427 [Solanum commersonii]|uniref:Uncharacterized protein n=1 Tax=Solanum commersonii TaxID=4109 RepID=A0A9J5YL14_SOLCO|nr:hypothetical protein H5410_032427 [Solanum commersonii]
MSGRSGGKTIETDDDSNKGGGQEKSGGQDNKNTNGKSKGSMMPARRGAIGKKILQDLNPWATEAS